MTIVSFSTNCINPTVHCITVYMSWGLTLHAYTWKSPAGIAPKYKLVIYTGVPLGESHLIGLPTVLHWHLGLPLVLIVFCGKPEACHYGLSGIFPHGPLVLHCFVHCTELLHIIHNTNYNTFGERRWCWSKQAVIEDGSCLASIANYMHTRTAVHEHTLHLTYLTQCSECDKHKGHFCPSACHVYAWFKYKYVHRVYKLVVSVHEHVTYLVLLYDVASVNLQWWNC